MSTAETAGTPAILASPFWSMSRTGGRGVGVGMREEMAVATPPPTTAPTAKQAMWMRDALGIVWEEKSFPKIAAV